MTFLSHLSATGRLASLSHTVYIDLVYRIKLAENEIEKLHNLLI